MNNNSVLTARGIGKTVKSGDSDLEAGCVSLEEARDAELRCPLVRLTRHALDFDRVRVERLPAEDGPILSREDLERAGVELALERVDRLKEELASAGQLDLAMLSVATSELRSLV